METVKIVTLYTFRQPRESIPPPRVRYTRDLGNIGNEAVNILTSQKKRLLLSTTRCFPGKMRSGSYTAAHGLGPVPGSADRYTYLGSPSGLVHRRSVSPNASNPSLSATSPPPLFAVNESEARRRFEVFSRRRALSSQRSASPKVAEGASRLISEHDSQQRRTASPTTTQTATKTVHERVGDTVAPPRPPSYPSATTVDDRWLRDATLAHLRILDAPPPPAVPSGAERSFSASPHDDHTAALFVLEGQEGRGGRHRDTELYEMTERAVQLHQALLAARKEITDLQGLVNALGGARVPRGATNSVGRGGGANPLRLSSPQYATEDLAAVRKMMHVGMRSATNFDRGSQTDGVVTIELATSSSESKGPLGGGVEGDGGHGTTEGISRRSSMAHHRSAAAAASSSSSPAGAASSNWSAPASKVLADEVDRRVFLTRIREMERMLVERSTQGAELQHRFEMEEESVALLRRLLEERDQQLKRANAMLVTTQRERDDALDQVTLAERSVDQSRSAAAGEGSMRLEVTRMQSMLRLRDDEIRGLYEALGDARRLAGSMQLAQQETSMRGQITRDQARAFESLRMLADA